MPEKNASRVNQSTEKAMAIIEFLAQSTGPARLRDISQRLQLNASTTLRFLNSLQNCGYVEQEAETQRYRLTYKICRVANQFSDHMELQTLTHPYLLALSERFHEALCVSVERDMSMVYIDAAIGPNQTLMSMQRVGNISPMHCTGNGKLLLLNYPEHRIDEMIRRKGLPRFTDHTIVTKEHLLAELSRIRADGVAYDNEECEIGVRCMACPIRDYSNRIVAGISVTGPVSRMTEENMRSFRPALAQAAGQISAALGWESSDFNN